MVQLIKKGGLRERANRSQRYQGSENSITTLNPNRYHQERTPHNNEAAPQVVNDEPKVLNTLK
jgi:hypothetical protein